MSKAKISARLRLGSYVILALALVSVWVFLLFPQWQSSRELHASRNVWKERLDFQNKHLPQYLEIEKKRRLPRPMPLGLPKEGKFSLAEMERFREIFQDLAQASNLTMVVLDPDLLVLAKGARLVPVTAELTGRFDDFRNYLIALISLPYLSHFSEIDIRQTDRGMTLKIAFHVIVG